MLRHASRFDTDVVVGARWQRYCLSVPLSRRKLAGLRWSDVSVRCSKVCNLFADAAQLEEGLAPTEFKVDGYRAVDLGPTYRREAVLGE